jgi:CheY-like chemotaxis protein
LKLVSENLLIRGYQVAEATTASAALEKISADKPSLMLLDIKLPDFTGWELLNRMEADPNISTDFPVLIMTASITDANMEMSKYPRVMEILIKPFSTTDLVSAVRKSLDEKPAKE